MKYLKLVNMLTEEEKVSLFSLVGKQICSIGSDNITINSGDIGIYRFHKWIRISTWNESDSYLLKYRYGETYSGDDFVTLSVLGKREEGRTALGSSISFSGNNIFKIKKIELYAEEWNHESVWDSEDIKIEDTLLQKDQQFCEYIYNENFIVLYNDDAKRILIKCQYSYLELIVTENEDFIDKFIGNNEFSKLKLVME